VSTVLVTGAAGFVGARLAERLCRDGREVVGVDNLSPYYDVALKEQRLGRLARFPSFRFVRADLAEPGALDPLLRPHPFGAVVHLAAQPGVRHSLHDPLSTVGANLVGLANVLEWARRAGVGHLLLASSSSVYGGDGDGAGTAGRPLSPYAATKRGGELLAHAWAASWGLPCTALRLFTVYGPWGRPDMAYFAFARAIVEGRPVELRRGGTMLRDFTFVDDVVEAIVRLVDRPPPAAPFPWRVLDVGAGRPAPVLRLLALLEERLGRAALRVLCDGGEGEPLETRADPAALLAETGFRPETALEDGIDRFARWFLEHRASSGPATGARSA
jgi:UDP-glucuronate 4-epimerase